MTVVASPAWTLADRLRKVRREYAHMKQAAFADAIGVSVKQISNWEAGANATSTDQLVQVAERIEELWGVPTWWLLGFRQPTVAGPSADPAGPTPPYVAVLAAA